MRNGKPRRSYLDTAEQITALLDAADELDAEANRYRHVQRRALLSVFVFAGLRIGELLDLRWGAVDLAADRIRVGHMKTDAGVRDVTIRPVLRDLLAALKASAPDACPRAYVFGTETGQRQTAGNGVDACSRRPSAGPTSGSRRRGADRGELLAAPLLSAVALGRHRTGPFR